MAKDLSPKKNLDYLTPRIALAEAKYIGPRYAQMFLERVGSIERIFSGVDVIRRLFPRQKDRLITELYRPELWTRAQNIAQWCIDEGVEVFFIGDKDYPKLLRECVDAPIVLYTKGGFDQWVSTRLLSVVGTRNVSTYGSTMTHKLLSELSKFAGQLGIVSGLAYGVDILAHRKALEFGLPTLAVLAHGFDRIYPAVHKQTAQDILKDGAWISEYPPGTKIDKYNFVTRNRIIAGLSTATLIVEAGLGSGSLITGNLARDYNREVLVVPGRVGDKYSEGCNLLIANMTGVLVQSGKDIAQLGGWLEAEADNIVQPKLSFTLHEEGEPSLQDNIIYEIVRTKQPIQFNDIVRLSSLSTSEVSTMLFDLEIDGYLRAMPGGLFTTAR